MSVSTDHHSKKSSPDYWLIIISVILIILSGFAIGFYPKASNRVVESLFQLATDNLMVPVIALFGFYTVYVLYIIFSKYGNIRLGEGKPHFNTTTYVFMFICAGVSSAILYWSLIEWTYYYTTPGINMEPLSKEALRNSVGYTIFNWGGPQWACYTFGSLAMAFYYHKRKYSDLSIGGFFEAVTGLKAQGLLGKVIDLFFLIGTVGGLTMTMVVTTLTFSAGLSSITHLPNNLVMHTCFILLVGSTFTLSSYIGIADGLKKLANIVCYAVLACCLLLLIIGPTNFIAANAINSIGFAISNFISLFTFTDPENNGLFYKEWSLFYWFWTIAYTPAVAIFAARVSHGRTMRELSCAMLFGGISCAWTIHLIFGGYSLSQFVNGVLDLPQLVMEQSGDFAIIEIIRTIPFPSIATIAFLFILLVFLASHVDAAAYTVATTTTKNLQQGQDPHPMLRLFWCIVVAVIPLAMIYSKVPIQTVKTAVIVSAVPFIIFLGIMTYGLLKWMKEDYGGKTVGEIDQESAELLSQSSKRPSIHSITN